MAPPQIRHLPHNLAAYRAPSPRGTTASWPSTAPPADAALLKSRRLPHIPSTWPHQLATCRTPSPRGTTASWPPAAPPADAALLESRHLPHTQPTWHHTS
ncbi:hypothetical protein ACSVDM_15920 [Nocardia sp. JW2]|uniref:hypothetical protein n=1 Tax=Nocardia sp. JW2 TaxID=3450738 RepID=UPI003F430317